MGKIIVYPDGFLKTSEEMAIYHRDLPYPLECDGFADFYTITMKGDQKCDIPTLGLFMSDVKRPVEFEMTWDEVYRLAEKLEAFLRRQDLKGLTDKVEAIAKRMELIAKSMEK